MARSAITLTTAATASTAITAANKHQVRPRHRLPLAVHLLHLLERDGAVRQRQHSLKGLPPQPCSHSRALPCLPGHLLKGYAKLIQGQPPIHPTPLRHHLHQGCSHCPLGGNG